MSVVSLPYAPASAAVARERMSYDMTDRTLPAEFVDDARLVLSELMSNALRHAQPLADGTVRVTWRYRRGCLELTVTDGGSPTFPHLARASRDSLGGRGLAIVRAVADDWGVRRRDSTCSVWARLSLPSAHRTESALRRGFTGADDVAVEERGG